MGNNSPKFRAPNRDKLFQNQLKNYFIYLKFFHHSFNFTWDIVFYILSNIGFRQLPYNLLSSQKENI